MKILSLKIENFGPLGHVDYKADSNASIVGLVGENGTGKSHVFRAIRYALTGDITDDNSTDTAASYIKDGTSVASVTLKFVKGPHTVTIMRRITPSSSSRELTVEGPDPCSGVKADKAVREKIEGVFGVDLDAAARCVFIPQGTFTKILFGPWSERESLMADVLGCVDYSMVKKHAVTMSGNLSRDLRDIQPIIDLHNSNVLRLNGEIATHVSQYSDMSTADVDSDIANWRVVLAERDARTRAAQELETLKSSIVNVEAPTTQAITMYAEAHKGLADALSALVYRQSTLSSQHLELSGLLTQQAAYVDGQTTLRGLVRSIVALNYPGDPNPTCVMSNDITVEELRHIATTTTVAKTADADQQELKELTEYVDALRVHHSALTELQNVVKPSIDTATRELEALVPQIEVAVTDKNQFTSTYEAGYNVAVQALDLITKLKAASKGQSCGNKCPVCNSETINIDAMIAMESTFRKTVNDYVLGLTTRTNTLNSLDVRKVAVSANLQILAARADVLKAGRELMTLESVMQTGVEASNKRAATQTRCEQNTHAVNEYKRLMAAISQLQFGPTAYTQDHVDATSAALHAVRLEGSTIAQAIEDRSSQANTALVKWQEAVAARTRVETVSANIATLEAKILALDSRCLSTSGYDVNSILAENIAKRDAIIGQRSFRAELIRQRDNADNELVKARAEAMESAKIKRACAFLDVAAALFDKKGFQAEHLSRKFGAIVRFVNDALSLMRTGFSVRASATAALEFEFSYDGETWKPMGKLSGGQRVRLTIAFMLAVQATELRNVGLLILDEPSNHVDEAGVEALVDMFTELYGYLAGNNMTVFICDHKVQMRRAFQDTITIKKNVPQ